MTDVNIACRCGKLKGTLHDASPSVGNRLICYCKSCQKFCTTLGADNVLDEFGGTEIYQVPIGSIEVTEGKEHLKCLRLTEKGAHRWYAGCCNTPIGNTGTASLPMMGVISTNMQLDDRDSAIGPVRFDGFVEDALKPLPAERHRGFLALLVIRFMTQMLYWRLSGRSKPNPVFDDTGRPIVTPINIWQGESL